MALVFALPGLRRFYLRTVHYLVHRGERARSAAAPDFPYSLRSGELQPCRTLREVISSSQRRLAFELYRNALRTHGLRVVTETIDEYASAMAFKPDEMPVRQALKAASDGLNLKAEFVRLLTAAVDQAPEFAEAHYELGCELRDEGRLDEALVHFKAAIKGIAFVIPGSHDMPIKSKAHLEAGMQLLRIGRAEEALPHLQQAARPYGGEGPISDEHAFPAASRVLAGVLRTLGRYEEAAEHYSLALVYRPRLQELPSLPLTLDAPVASQRRDAN